MPDPISLVPLPQHVAWSDQVWETETPWDDLTIGISGDLDRSHYDLTITPTGARLTAGSEAALADGRNTFSQILLGAGGSIPCVTISDHPLYAWRGMHVDVSRHFFELEELRRLVDSLALHRLNVLHLHLTDDQGWRVEIKGYPRLTEVGAWRPRTMIGHMSSEDQEDLEFDDVPPRRVLHPGPAAGTWWPTRRPAGS
jgi:hexosaminidase